MADLLFRSGGFIESMLKLTRFGNLVMIAFAQYFTAAFLIDKQTVFDLRLFLLSLSTVVIAAAGYIINDYYDVKIDYINKPDRVVIGKSITRRFAILFHVLLSVCGIALGVYLSWRITALNVASVFLLWIYSNSLKRMPFIGNLTVALLTGAAVYSAEMLYHSGNALIVVFAIFAMFMTLIREIIKDIEDLKGDNTFGCKTLPIVWGIRRTKIVLYAIVIIFSITVVLLNYQFRALPFRYQIIFLFLPLLVLIWKLIRADTRLDFIHLSTLCKVIMLMGIASMAFV
ncbi:geranylgeranylglycerol-phosphate geranylgeranyltransferase [Chryseolinea sp. T2]|uniref:geranylgeranylglycerol-phosphate geranylgeranyltransferase n=1 Tax=Chryseolinea sp. T2 TaxID=3129255 RepID=UPI003077D710